MNETIHAIEGDLYIPGNILILRGCSLMTANGTSAEIVIGNQTECPSDAFVRPTSFAQISEKYIYILDTDDHCGYNYNRFSGYLRVQIGRCGFEGDEDNRRTSTRLRYPQNAVYDAGASSIAVYFTTLDTNIPPLLKLRYYTESTSRTTTITGIGGAADPLLTLFPAISISHFYYTTPSGIFKKDRYNTVRINSGSEVGDGFLSEHKLYQPYQGVEIFENLIIVYDEGDDKNMLRMLDANQDLLATLCLGNSMEDEDGAVSLCKILPLNGLTYSDGYVYLADDFGIKRMHGKYLNG